jgi:peptidoglycan-associated lipoprotein
MKFAEIRNHLFTLALAAGLAACNKAEVKPDASAQKQTAPTTQADASDQKQPPTAEQYHAQGQADLDKALEQLRNVSLFFEFDAATLTKEAQDKLSVVAEILVKHAELTVRIEGNCDERGSEQYNLALGQRRAEAGKKYLDQLGVKDKQITAISFGAEKPKANGHDEEAWKQNRRDDVNAQK